MSNKAKKAEDVLDILESLMGFSSSSVNIADRGYKTSTNVVDGLYLQETYTANSLQEISDQTGLLASLMGAAVTVAAFFEDKADLVLALGVTVATGGAAIGLEKASKFKGDYVAAYAFEFFGSDKDTNDHKKTDDNVRVEIDFTKKTDNVRFFVVEKVEENGTKKWMDVGVATINGIPKDYSPNILTTTNVAINNRINYQIAIISNALGGDYAVAGPGQRTTANLTPDEIFIHDTDVPGSNERDNDINIALLNSDNTGLVSYGTHTYNYTTQTIGPNGELGPVVNHTTVMMDFGDDDEQSGGGFWSGLADFFGFPVGIDLDGDSKISINGVDSSSALFDMDGDGKRNAVAWISANDGLLAYDKNNDGIIKDQDEISFLSYLSGAQTDLEGLRAFDSNANGLLDAGDAHWGLFRVWQDANQDGASAAGELVTLTAAGITSIALTSDNNTRREGDAVVFGATQVGHSNGTASVAWDMALGYSPVSIGTAADGSLTVQIVPGLTLQQAVGPQGVVMNIVSEDMAGSLAGDENNLMLAGTTLPVLLSGGGGSDTLEGGIDGDILLGGTGNDQLSGLGGDDILSSDEGDDLLRGGAGNDTLIGGEGRDVAYYGDRAENYAIQRMADGKVVVVHTNGVLSAAEGTDELHDIEELRFADGVIDLSQVASVGALPASAFPVMAKASLSNITASAQFFQSGEDDWTDYYLSFKVLGEPGQRFQWEVEQYFLTGDRMLTNGAVSTGGAITTKLVPHVTMDGFKIRVRNMAGALITEQYFQRVQEVYVNSEDSRYVFNWSGTTAADLSAIQWGQGSYTVVPGQTSPAYVAGITQQAGAINTVLTGAAGHDTLTGGAGNDTLVGGAGFDSLVGGAGTDVADFSAAASAVFVSLRDGRGYLGDARGDTYAGIENVTGSAYADTLEGDGLGNILTGGEGNDTLQGFAGNDTLIGGLGIDTYHFGLGDGQDVIADGGTWGGENVLAFGAGLDSDDLWIYRQGNDLRVGVVGGSDGLTMPDWYVNPGNQIPTFVLSDGRKLAGYDIHLLIEAMAPFAPPVGAGAVMADSTRQALAPTLAALWKGIQVNGTDGPDTLTGGKGNDTLIGGLGIDTYHFGLGDGQDVIADGGPLGGENVLAFGAGLDSADLWIYRQGNDLRVGVVGGSDGLTMSDWYVKPGNQIPTFVLSDGRKLAGYDIHLLIEAMAPFAPPVGAGAVMADSTRQALAPTLAALWKAA
jgi:Ca2+-binding RTX toxin-like protein